MYRASPWLYRYNKIEMFAFQKRSVKGDRYTFDETTAQSAIKIAWHEWDVNMAIVFLYRKAEFDSMYSLYVDLHLFSNSVNQTTADRFDMNTARGYEMVCT